MANKINDRLNHLEKTLNEKDQRIDQLEKKTLAAASTSLNSHSTTWNNTADYRLSVSPVLQKKPTVNIYIYTFKIKSKTWKNVM